MTATANTLVQKIEAYKKLDVTELYTLLGKAREESDLLALIGAGVYQGRHDVMNEAYTNITFLRLEKAHGMTPEMLNQEREDLRVPVLTIDDWLEDEKHLDELCMLFEVVPAEPHESVLKNALKVAVRSRGTSIDDFQTSVGHLYQRVHGRDFEMARMTFTNEDTGDVTSVPYNQLPLEDKNRLNVEILKAKNYIV